MKKVRTLLRVSSGKQLDKNDIPMQRIVCNEFIERMTDWVFDKEYIEKGVSGYNKKLEDRDVLQEIKNDALVGEFDILLVFMFDRLGRREDETPFIVEWFVKHGLEVWSTQEGEQRFDSRADKLINYIRYWQSGGESEKTSIRVRTKQKQMIEQGINITSVPPYGYELVKNGVFTKRGVERKELRVLPSEAEVVKKIFDLTTEEGYGGVRIANYLNEHNIKTHKNNNWSANAVNKLIRNPVYTGLLVYGKTSVPIGGGKRKTQDKSKWIFSNEINSNMVIISKEQFEKAQEIKNRRNETNKKQTESNKKCIYQTKGLLFTGYLICGSCGSKLTTRSSKRKIKLDDGSYGYTYYKYYSCGVRIDGRHECNCKKKSHKSNCIEEPVLKEIYSYLDRLEKIDLRREIKRINEKTNSIEGEKIRELERKIKECSNKNELFKDEIINIIQGKSTFTREMITELIEENKNKKQELINQKIELEKIEKQKKVKFEELLKVKQLIPNWKQEFIDSTEEKKKMMLSTIVDKIVVNDDDIEIQLKMNLGEFIKDSKLLENKEDSASLKNVSKDFENLSCRRTSIPNSNMGTF